MGAEVLPKRWWQGLARRRAEVVEEPPALRQQQKALMQQKAKLEAVRVQQLQEELWAPPQRSRRHAKDRAATPDHWVPNLAARLSAAARAKSQPQQRLAAKAAARKRSKTPPRKELSHGLVAASRPHDASRVWLSSATRPAAAAPKDTPHRVAQGRPEGSGQARRWEGLSSTVQRPRER